MRKRERGSDDASDNELPKVVPQASTADVTTAANNSSSSRRKLQSHVLDEDDVLLVDQYAPQKSLLPKDRGLDTPSGNSKNNNTKKPLRPARRVSLLQPQPKDTLLPLTVHPPRPFIVLDGRRYSLIPTGVWTLLLPHQREGVEFILRRLLGSRCGCILGDYMGLGKTLQVVSMLAIILGTRAFSERCLLDYTGIPQLRKPRPLRILVVAPGPVVPHWVSEFVRFGKSLTTLCQTSGTEQDGSRKRCKKVRAEDGQVRSITLFRVFGEAQQQDEKTEALSPKPTLTNEQHEGNDGDDDDDVVQGADDFVDGEADAIDEDGEEKEEEEDVSDKAAVLQKSRKMPKSTKRRAVLVYEHLAEYADRDELVMSFQRTGGILCISYNQLLRYSPKLLKPDILIVDEGHRIRNESTLVSAYMAQIQTKLRIIATGYPLQNNLGELYQLLDFVTSGASSKDDMLGSLQAFRKNFQEPVTRAVTQGVSNSATKEWELRRGLLLYYRIQPYILRRGLFVLSELIQLPRSIYLVSLRPTMDQLRAYNWYLQFGTSFDLPIIGSQLLLLPLSKVKSRAEVNTSALRQMFAREGQLLASPAPSPKMLLLWSILRTAKKQRRKVIVFSQFLGSLDECMTFVDEKNRHSISGSGRSDDHCSSITIVRCDGTMPVPTRMANCAAFNDPNGSVDVLAFSLRTGCEGINLTAASIVISLDLSWNPALEHEAFARAYRIGQQKLLDVVMLVTAGSIEEIAYQRQVAKCLVVDACIDGGMKRAIDSSGPSKCCPLAPETTVEENLGHYPDLSCLELHSILREALGAEPALVHSVVQCSAAVTTSFDNTELDESICKFSVSSCQKNPDLKAKIEKSLLLAEEELRLQRMYGEHSLDSGGTSASADKPLLTTFVGDGSSLEAPVVAGPTGQKDDDDFDFE